MPVRIDSDGAGGSIIGVKAVPGSSRDAIAGALGERLKVRITAPPEAGKANKAICELIAAHVGRKPRDVEIIAGHSAPEKQVRIRGIAVEELRAALPE